MDNTNILIKIQELTKELDMLKRSLNYKDELQAAREDISEAVATCVYAGHKPEYLVISRWLFVALKEDAQKYAAFEKSDTGKYLYRTSYGYLNIIPLNVTERVIMIG